MYQTVITLNMSFLIFTFGSLLVAIQIAGGQLTPRVIATTLLRDNVVRYSVGLFVFALIFSVMALNRMEDKVHDLVTFITGLPGRRDHRGFSVPDRLRGAPASTGEHPRARGRGGPAGDCRGVSRSGRSR